MRDLKWTIYFFDWMERTLPLEVDTDADDNVSGQLWMVHGGGFYLVEKQTKPKVMPRTLHWFKWESALTFLSGFFLLIVTFLCEEGFPYKMSNHNQRATYAASKSREQLSCAATAV